MTLISIVVCTYNRAEVLKVTLDGLLRQEVHGAFDYEILVIDNNSTDHSKSVVEEFIPRSGGKMKYFFQPVQGKSESLNMAVPLAKGDIVAFTDDDVVLSPSWLYELYQCFAEHGCDGVGGRVLPIYPEGTPVWVRENPHQVAGAVVIYDHGEGVREFDQTMELFIGANYAFHREVFDHCGMFRTDLRYNGVHIGEDREFIRRLIKTGKVLYYCGKAVVWHPVDLKRLRFRPMVRWHMAAGRCAADLESEDKSEMFVCCFGFPRYLLKGICGDALGMALNAFDRVKFFRNFRGFFRKLGMILQYRVLAKRARGNDGQG
ncbi:MAG: glycosyltransferase family 2 protein [Candidatus Omnitrophota bacterium]|nr:glycosyltransferase family 2 protein [Candidatus Omnitrophota bacterium]MDZ4241615.1 glycosyltransferase family 2 protein [Candidatus Omnitrophota bacterium]